MPPKKPPGVGGLIEPAGVLEIEAEAGEVVLHVATLRPVGPSGSSVICVAPSVKAEGSLPEPVISLRVAVDGRPGARRRGPAQSP